MKTLNRILALTQHPAFRPTIMLLALAVAWLHPDSAVLASGFMLGALTEGQHTGEFIISEANGSRSRENATVTVPANTTLEAGHVLAKLTATGKYVEYDNAGSDGSESAAGILYATLINDTGAPVDIDGVVVNTDAEVRSADLQWKTGLVGADETAGLADLLALGIKAR